MPPSILSKYNSTKHKTRLAEPFGQRLRELSPALLASHVGHYTSKPLPCIKSPQTAAKIIIKGQQTLVTIEQRKVGIRTVIAA